MACQHLLGFFSFIMDLILINQCNDSFNWGLYFHSLLLSTLQNWLFVVHCKIMYESCIDPSGKISFNVDKPVLYRLLPDHDTIS